MVLVSLPRRQSTARGQDPTTRCGPAFWGHSNATTSGTTTHTNHYSFAGKLIAHRDTAVHFVLTDQLGSPVLQLSASGAAEQAVLHTPYGVSRYGASDLFGYGLTGQRQDDTPALDYYNARSYDPAVGQFISADTVLPGKGYALAGLNRYAYVGGNPETATDPSGHRIDDGGGDGGGDGGSGGCQGGNRNCGHSGDDSGCGGCARRTTHTGDSSDGDNGGVTGGCKGGNRNCSAYADRGVCVSYKCAKVLPYNQPLCDTDATACVSGNNAIGLWHLAGSVLGGAITVVVNAQNLPKLIGWLRSVMANGDSWLNAQIQNGLEVVGALWAAAGFQYTPWPVKALAGLGGLAAAGITAMFQQMKQQFDSMMTSIIRQLSNAQRDIAAGKWGAGGKNAEFVVSEVDNGDLEVPGAWQNQTFSVTTYVPECPCG